MLFRPFFPYCNRESWFIFIRYIKKTLSWFQYALPLSFYIIFYFYLPYNILKFYPNIFLFQKAIYFKDGGLYAISILYREWSEWISVGCSICPQSPSFPQKLVTALKNKIHTLHSTIHAYHRCFGINTVITLNLIVSNRLLFPEDTSS